MLLPFSECCLVCTHIFCPEMPEASSYSAQNSTDLSAATSPGSSYLISFCKSLTHWLLAFLLSRFLSLLTVSLIVFFPQRIWFSFFSGLNSTWLFISPRPNPTPHPPKHSMVYKGGGLGEWRRLCHVISPLRGTHLRPRRWQCPSSCCPRADYHHQFRGSVSFGWDFLLLFIFLNLPFVLFFFSSLFSFPLLSFLSYCLIFKKFKWYLSQITR